jgi:hypothetical protein
VLTEAEVARDVEVEVKEAGAAPGVARQVAGLADEREA